jgi:hypothetical protein
MAYEWPVLAVPAWLYDPTHDDGPSSSPAAAKLHPTTPRHRRGRPPRPPPCFPLLLALASARLHGHGSSSVIGAYCCSTAAPRV